MKFTQIFFGIVKTELIFLEPDPLKKRNHWIYVMFLTSCILVFFSLNFEIRHFYVYTTIKITVFPIFIIIIYIYTYNSPKFFFLLSQFFYYIEKKTSVSVIKLRISSPLSQSNTFFFNTGVGQVS